MRRGLCALSIFATAACSDDHTEPERPTECNPQVEQQTIETTLHVDGCSKVTYESNPPSSGNHYPIWGAFGVYDAALPRGFWVHDLEHGAVVVTHHCKNGCDSDIAAAEAWVESASVEPSCTAGPRLMLIPDPLLDIEWAASAWGWTLRARCFDEAAFNDFYEQHRGGGPEDICVPGEDYRKPDGSLNIPKGCGK